MAARHRYERTLPLDSMTATYPAPIGGIIRNPLPADAEELAALMIDAYRGAIDDGGETFEDALAEVTAYFAGESGKPLLANSWICLIDNAPQSAVLVSFWQNSPLIAYVMTRPAWKGHGIGSTLLHSALSSLGSAHFRVVRAIVTQGNLPSEKLLANFGFTQMPD